MNEQPVSPDITQDDKVWSLLSWLIWPVALAALLMNDKKVRPFIKYNAVHALAFAVVLYILGAVTAGGLYAIGAVYAIVLAVQAYQGKWANVPLLTDFIKKQNWV